MDRELLNDSSALIRKVSYAGRKEVENMLLRELTDEEIKYYLEQNKRALEKLKALKELYPIVTDEKADYVYFSKDIIYYQCWKYLKPLLEKKNINYSFIHNTKDLWVRDFMPIQIYDGKYIQFVFNPDYLQDTKEYMTNPEDCTKNLDCKIINCDIILDGGNVIKCDDCVIVTDKVVKDNSVYSPFKLKRKLERFFETEVIIIPRDENEECGHADGMLRYIGNNRILLNHYLDFDVALRNRIIDSLNGRFEIEELYFHTDKHLSTSWAYLNYLQVGNVLFVPVFNNKLDDIALKQLEDKTGKEVYPVFSKSTVKIGGGLNCLSLTVKREFV